MTDKIVVLTTCSSREEAQRIARRLVEARLAACVQVSAPIQSVYHWQGAVEESEETMLVIKSSRPLWERLRVEIVRLHSYSTPEVVALPIIDGAPDYLAWMERELGG
jgi:periplasmic divalent cation tolerance protein